MLIKTLATLCASLLLSGCATYSSNIRVGNDMSYASLLDQREAARGIQVFDVMPEGATVLGKVDAGRCHESFLENAPEETLVILDLKIAAYALGADGIANVKVDKESALSVACWYMLDGEAVAVSLP